MATTGRPRVGSTEGSRTIGGRPSRLVRATLGIVVAGCLALTLGGCADRRPEYHVEYVGGPLSSTAVEAVLQEQASAGLRFVDAATVPPTEDGPHPGLILIFERR